MNTDYMKFRLEIAAELMQNRVRRFFHQLWKRVTGKM
jgi:hypothetical protein